MSPSVTVLCGIVLAGSSVQRLTGMGFALVAAPALVLLLGPGPVLLTTMGALVTGAVLTVMAGVRAPALRGRRGAVAAGTVSGLMNSAAGVGGPAVSLYAVNAGWTVREFVPNAQFYGLIVNVLSIAAKGPPALTAPVWLFTGTAMGAGVLVGAMLAGRVPERRARRLVMLLALAGGLATAGKGVTAS
ncbi:hypothetical protein Aca07nite_76710 [Actinoplanes capillaceus]|uniref:Membrane transporter protein n=1 Tax=Actinoplanes campanulatus TaxID=113559 RepID=A0ABQ3WW71_9ACTN|nr:TSUP family transporter [Actinoplanes capillaceus]GID50396.1 hypothetical protein Aca07nite_76710 [Actinoplanes capillaceus]